MSSQNEDTGFQKYIANRLSPLSDTEFEVLRSLIWGCAYNEYFDPKQFSEAKYKSITLSLQERVGEPDPVLFLDAAHLHGLVLKSPTPDATIVWPLFSEMEENKVEDGLYLWSVHEIYQMMKQELTDFEALDDEAKQVALETSKVGKSLKVFSLELASLNAENKEKIESLEVLGAENLSVFLRKRMDDHLNIEMATDEGTNAKNQIKQWVESELSKG